MKIKLFFTVILTVLFAATGTVIAGPGDKGKGSAVIAHSNSSDDGDGSVEIAVSFPGAVAHLGNHDGDCINPGSNPAATEDELAVALNTTVEELACDDISFPPE